MKKIKSNIFGKIWYLIFYLDGKKWKSELKEIIIEVDILK